MVVRVKEFQTVLGRIDDMVNKFLTEKKLPRKAIIDIKYTAIATGIMALLIYDDGKKTYQKTIDIKKKNKKKKTYGIF